MNKLLLLLSVVFLPLLSTAQENFIEVAVTEMVELKATKFVYTLSSEDDWMNAMERLDYYSEDDEETHEDDEIPQLTMDDLAKILKKEKFNFKRSADKDYSLKKGKDDIIVFLESIDELNRLKKRLMSEQMEITGKITETIYESIDKHYATVYPILMAKAQAQAEILAGSADRKVGKVLRISDTQSTSGSDFWSTYMKNIMEMMKDREGDQLVGFKQHPVTKTYRFELL